jgi:hypothetical protein
MVSNPDGSGVARMFLFFGWVDSWVIFLCASKTTIIHNCIKR